MAPRFGSILEMADLKGGLRSIHKRTAKGSDEIPASVIEELDDLGLSFLLRCFNSILEGSCELSEEWKERRVTMLKKPNSITGELRSYRPITE